MSNTNINSIGARLVGVDDPTRDDHAATKGYVDAHGGGGSVSVTDGTHTVTGTTELDFTSGATVTDAGGGVAQVAVAGGGSQPDVPIADPVAANVDDTTYSDPWGGPRKVAALVADSGDASLVVLAVDGDAFPRIVLTGGNLFIGDGTSDPTLSSQFYFSAGALNLSSQLVPVLAATPTAVPQIVQLSPRFSITSGAIPSTAVTSGVGLQPSPNADVEVVTSVAFGSGGGGGGISGSCTVAISPDNVTYTDVAVPAGTDATQLLSVRVPGGWYVKFTASGAATLAANVFIY